MLTLNILAKQLKVTNVVQVLRDQMNNLQINPSEFHSGSNVGDCSIRESRNFNKHIRQSNASNSGIRWTQCRIFYWAHLSRSEATSSQSTRTTLRHHRAETHRKSDGQESMLRQIFEKLEYLFGKTQNFTALKVQRDMCIQRYNENIDEFINRFLRIHDTIIITINSRSNGVATICIQEEFCQNDGRKSIKIFCRKIWNWRSHLLLRVRHSKSSVFENESFRKRILVKKIMHTTQ